MDSKDLQTKQISHKIIDNFDLIPKEIRVPVFISLAQSSNEKVRAQTASALVRNFSDLPSELQDLLPTLARDKSLEVKEVLIDEIRENFSKISPEVREDLIYSFSVDENEGIRIGAAVLIAENYFSLPQAVRKLLVVLGNDRSEEVSKKVANLILEHIYVEAIGEPDLKQILEKNMDAIEKRLEFQIKLVDAKSGILDFNLLEDLENLPELMQDDMITALKCGIVSAKNPSVRKKVAEAFLENYSKLPEECKRLVVNISEDESEEVRDVLGLGITQIFSEIPDDVKILVIENLMKNSILSKDVRVRKNIASLVMSNFKLLSAKTQAGLVELCKDENIDVREYVVQGLSTNFNFLNSSMREEMLRILMNDKSQLVRACVVSILSHNFQKIWDADTYLETFIEDKNAEVRRILIREVMNNFYSISKDVREKIILGLSKDKEESIRILVASAILENYHALSVKEKAVLKVLLGDSENVKLSIIDTLSHPKKFDRLPRTAREEMLRIFINDKSPRVRTRVALLLLDTFSILSKKNRNFLIRLGKDSEVEVRRAVARGLEYNFGVVWNAKNIASELLKLLSEDEDSFIRKKCADIIISHLDILNKEKEIISILVKLGKDKSKEVAEEVAENILQNIGHMPKPVRDELLDYYSKEHGARRLDLARIMKCAVISVYKNFSHFPEKAEKMLLLALKDKNKEVREEVAKGLDAHFDDLPKKLRNELAYNLSLDKEVSVKLAVLPVIVEEFISIDKASEILRGFAKDENWDVREFLAHELGVYLDRIPDELAEELLLKLSEDKNANVRRAVVHSCVRNYLVLEKSLQDKLKEFAIDKDAKVRHELLIEVSRNPSIPDEVKDKIKKTIMEK
ncbi:MAG: HEAT repeat domain-containing protein [Thermoplasmata archaeon]